MINTTHTQNWKRMYELFSRKFTPSNVSMDMYTIRPNDRSNTIIYRHVLIRWRSLSETVIMLKRF